MGRSGSPALISVLIRPRFLQRGTGAPLLRRGLAWLACADAPVFVVSAFDHFHAASAQTIDEFLAIGVDVSVEDAPSVRDVDLFVGQRPDDGFEFVGRQRLGGRHGFHTLDCRGLAGAGQWPL